MSTPQRLVAFALAAAATFGAGIGLGAAVGPDPAAPVPAVEQIEEHEAPSTGFGTGGFGGHDTEHSS